ncbi:hypothetical protein O1611_g661 [Lasiodiplodia mahajangana]|uniref:Uncharacterized protein n=1 Tax=Lasiodiplodia mahajangana TaxID=1108764 RepID=A0ACC2JZP1_9PEZI|nr:hypothetical protein O1611_g661 [Lasiodiplodia mahajangana]
MIEPLPVLNPAGVAVGTGVFVTPPGIRVVQVHGLRGISDEVNRPWWPAHWMPPGSSTISFPFSPSSIVGNEHPGDALEEEARKLLDTLKSECFRRPLVLPCGDSYILWAEDIGGAIVKLALGIAAQETKYERVLNSIQTVVFWGTPHQGSKNYSLDSTVHAIIEACYNGLIGNWFPAKINALSRKLEDVNNKFSPVSHRFTIISCYQRPSPLNLFDVLVTKECATLGLENEVTIGFARPHKDMARLMNREEESVLQTYLINSSIGHWSGFKHCMDLLESAYRKHEVGRQVSSRLRSTEAISRLASDSKLKNWISSEASPRYLTIKLPDLADPIEILNSIAWAMWMYPETLWLACPSIDAYGGSGGLREESWIYASLLQQVLTQQPRAFLYMKHLVPLLADAIRGSIASWTERALWLCLKTVLHAPTRSPLYGFLHVKTSTDADAVRRIDSALQGTDCMFRLVLSFTDNLQVDLKDVDRLKLGLDWIDPEERYSATRGVNPETGSFGGNGQDGSSVPDPAWPMRHPGQMNDLQLQLLTLRIQAMSRPIYIALIWIAFSIRPLYVDELELLLDFDRDANSASVTTCADRRSNFTTRLMKVFPDIVLTKNGRVFANVSYDTLRDILHQLSQNYLAPALTPHLYIARSCLTVLASYALKTTDYPAVETNTGCSRASDNARASIGDTESADKNKPEQANSEPTPIPEAGVPGFHETKPTIKEKSYPWGFDDMTTNQRTLADYTARNWLTHYELSRIDGESELNDEAYLAFVSDGGNVRNWLYLLEHLTDPSQKTSSRFTSDSFDLLQQHLDITKLEDLKTLYRLASRQSSLSSLGCLLTDAAEVGNETVVRSLLANVDSLPEEGIIRALATTYGSAPDEMRRSCAVFLERQHPRRLAQVQLTAQVLGNERTSRLLSEELLAMPMSLERDGWYEDALHRAIEYSDDAMIGFLESRYVPRHPESRQGSEWSLIHRAVSHGDLRSLTRLWKAGLKHDVNVLSPDHRSPLFIASSYGFSEITRFLASNGAVVDNTNGNLNQTALHIASDYGHWGTTKMLLSHGADTTSFDKEGNFPLHRAILKAHVRLAELLIEHFPSSRDERLSTRYSSAATPHSETISSIEFGDNDVLIADNSLAVEPTTDQEAALSGSSLLDTANIQGQTVLFVAAARELPTICRRLLEQGADPNMLADCTRVPLHMASKAGSIDLVQHLLDKGAVINHRMDNDFVIPLHYACYRGHVEVAKALAGHSHRDSRDSLNHTPFSAACSGGHIHIVEALVDYYGKEDRLEGLIAAVRSGHRDVVIYLLEMGCQVNAKTVYGETALGVAASSPNSRITQILLQRGAEPDIENDNGESPLGLAIYWEQESAVRLLLEKGAKMRSPKRFSHHTNLLDFSSSLSSKPITEILLASYRRGGNPIVKASIDHQIPGKGTPLHAAIDAIKDSGELVEVLLENGANPEISARPFGTPLNTACAKAKLDIAEKLLLKLPRLSEYPITGKYGTPLQSAIVGFKEEPDEITIKMLHLLNEHDYGPKGSGNQNGGAYGSAFHAATYLSTWEVVQWYVENSSGNTPFTVDRAGRHPWNLAILRGDWFIAERILTQALVQAGLPGLAPEAFVNLMSQDDKQGLTGLHYAAISSSETMITTILTWCNKVSWGKRLIASRDGDGWTPLHWACRQPKKEIVNTLIANGADVEALTNESWTPFQIARFHGITDEEYLSVLSDIGDQGEEPPEGVEPRAGKECCGYCFIPLGWKYYRCQEKDCHIMLDLSDPSSS